MLDTAFDSVLAQAQAGDEAAFTDIFRDLQPTLLRYLYVLSPEAADDVASETWLQVVAGLGAFRGEERAFRAWVFTIARHRAVDWGRSRSRRASLAALLSGEADRLTAPDTADVVLERIGTTAVLESIATLPRDQAEIVLLRVVAGLDPADVARIVGKSQGAIRVAAHRALRRLAKDFDRTGVTL